MAAPHLSMCRLLEAVARAAPRAAKILWVVRAAQEEEVELRAAGPRIRPEAVVPPLQIT